MPILRPSPVGRETRDSGENPSCMGSNWWDSNDQSLTCICTLPLPICVLGRPKVLELTAVNEMVVTENLQIFRMNGFQFQVNPEGHRWLLQGRNHTYSLVGCRGCTCALWDSNELSSICSGPPDNCNDLVRSPMCGCISEVNREVSSRRWAPTGPSAITAIFQI